MNITTDGLTPEQATAALSILLEARERDHFDAVLLSSGNEEILAEVVEELQNKLTEVKDKLQRK